VFVCSIKGIRKALEAKQSDDSLHHAEVETDYMQQGDMENSNEGDGERDAENTEQDFSLVGQDEGAGGTEASAGYVLAVQVHSKGDVVRLYGGADRAGVYGRAKVHPHPHFLVYSILPVDSATSMYLWPMGCIEYCDSNFKVDFFLASSSHKIVDYWMDVFFCTKQTNWIKTKASSLAAVASLDLLPHCALSYGICHFFSLYICIT
jgi:hypothetical protein